MQKHRALAKNIFFQDSLYLFPFEQQLTISLTVRAAYSLFPLIASRQFEVAGEDNNAWYIFSAPCIIVVLKTHTDTVHLFSKVASTTYKRQFKSSAFRYEYYYQDT